MALSGIEEDRTVPLRHLDHAIEEEKGWNRQDRHRSDETLAPPGVCLVADRPLPKPIQLHQHLLGEPLNPLDMSRLAVPP